MEPVKKIVLTHLLVKELWEKSQTPKPTALNTPLRYSSAWSCGRQQGYAAFDAMPTEPMDEAGAWVTGIGTLVHEALQDAILRQFPTAQFEVASGADFVSGSCDAFIPVKDLGTDYGYIGGTHVLYELKTMGSYGFDKQVGWKRMKGEFSYPEGPAKKAIAQAGMNALGIEGGDDSVHIETVIMGSITFEALSKQKADRMNLSGYDRVLAEFHIDRAIWEPLAMAELERMNGMHYNIENGYLPERIALNDDGRLEELDPNGRAWQCEYCAFRTVCLEDGPGQVWINQSNLQKRSES